MPTAKINGRHTWRRRLKIERVCRLTGAGYTDAQIALAMGITVVYVSMLRRTPEYVAIQSGVMTGVIADYDRLLQEDTEVQVETLKTMVPDAMLALRDSLYDRSNPKLRFEAAKEVLDREGSLAKISKTEIKKKVEFDFKEKDGVDEDLVLMFQNAKNIDSKDSLDDFVNSAIDPEIQQKLHAALDLEDLPVDSKSIN
jgi:hypothetical protein